MARTTFSGPVVSQAGFISGTDSVSSSITASTLTLDDSYNGITANINRAAGTAITLPAATGTQAVYRILLGTTVTSNSTTISVADATDVMQGAAVVTASTPGAFYTTATSDTITMNGSTTGGLAGSYVELKDAATNLWIVSAVLVGSGTVATPFSAAVS